MKLGTPYITNTNNTNRIPCPHLNRITPASHFQAQEASPLDQHHFPPLPRRRHQPPSPPPLSVPPSSISDSGLLSPLFVSRHFLPAVVVVELFPPPLFCVSALIPFPRATISPSKWNIDTEERRGASKEMKKWITERRTSRKGVKTLRDSGEVHSSYAHTDETKPSHHTFPPQSWPIPTSISALFQSTWLPFAEFRQPPASHSELWFRLSRPRRFHSRNHSLDCLERSRLRRLNCWDLEGWIWLRFCGLCGGRRRVWWRWRSGGCRLCRWRRGLWRWRRKRKRSLGREFEIYCREGRDGLNSLR